MIHQMIRRTVGRLMSFHGRRKDTLRGGFGRGVSGVRHLLGSVRPCRARHMTGVHRHVASTLRGAVDISCSGGHLRRRLVCCVRGLSVGRRGRQLDGRLECFHRAVTNNRKRKGGLNFVTRRVKHRVGAANDGSGRTRVRGVMIRVGSRLRRVGRRILGMVWPIRVPSAVLVDGRSECNGEGACRFFDPLEFKRVGRCRLSISAGPRPIFLCFYRRPPSSQGEAT